MKKTRNILLSPLRPENVKNKNLDKPFGVFDIEATNWKDFLILGYQGLTSKGIEYKEFLSIKEFCDFLFSQENKCEDVYAHFGGIYDFLFILQHLYGNLKYKQSDLIARGSGLLCFKSTMKFENGNERTINFIDSSGILPFSLASLTNNFDVKHKKITDIDIEKVTKITPKLKEYLEYDVKGLYESIEAYRNSSIVKSVGRCLTTASQAVKYFRTYLEDPLPSATAFENEFVRKSYFGGRTEIFRQLFKGSKENQITCYDFNSLYPSVMQKNAFPIRSNGETKNLDVEFGFFDCTVYVPEMYIPPLPSLIEIHKTKKLLFPCGTFRGTFTSIELQYAMSLGVKVLKIHSGLKYESCGYLFKDFITDMYEVRKNTPKNSVDNQLAKLVMNSLYGRFGLDRNKEELVDHIVDGGTLHSEFETDNGHLVEFYLVPKILDKSYSNVAIASWVTSLGRIELHKKMFECQDSLYNTDTDSLFTTHNFVSNANELGALKIEKQATNACFLLPKTYMFDLQKKMKGFEKRKIGHLTFDDFVHQLGGEIRLIQPKTVRMKKFRSALKTGSFLATYEEQGRQVTARYDKRRTLKTPDYNTEPWFIKNNEIINMV